MMHSRVFGKAVRASFGLLPVASSARRAFMTAAMTGRTTPSGLMQLLNAKNYVQLESSFGELEAPGCDDYSALMWGRLRSGQGDSVFELEQEMREKGVQPDSGVYNCLLYATRRKGNLEAFETLWERMKADGVTPHVYGVNLYLEAVRDAARDRNSPGRRDVAASMLEVYQEAGVKGNERTFNLLIMACAAQNAHQVAMKVLEEMESCGHVISFGQAQQLVAVGLARNSQPLATIGLDLVRRSGGQLDEGTLMGLVQLWAARGNYLNVLAVESELAERFPDSQPSEAFYRLAVHALTKPASRKLPSGIEDTPWSVVFAVLGRMMAAGHPVDSKLLLRRLTLPMRNLQNLDRAYYALDEMRVEGKPVPLFFLNLVIRGCAKSGDLDRAFATFAEIPAFGLEPDVSSYSELLGACCQAKDGDAAAHVEQQMLSAGVEMDDICRRYLTTVFINPKHFRKAAQYINGEYFRYAPETLHSLLHFLVKAGELEQARSLHQGVTEALPNFRLSDNLRQRLGQSAADEPLASRRD